MSYLGLHPQANDKRNSGPAKRAKVGQGAAPTNMQASDYQVMNASRPKALSFKEGVISSLSCV